MMNTTTAWILFLFILGTLPASGQTSVVSREAKLEVLSKSAVLNAQDLRQTETMNPFLIDRWHLIAVAGWTIRTYPTGKGEPPYPILAETLWNQYAPLDLELLGYIHRLPNRPNRYRIGASRQVISLLPASQLNDMINQARASEQMADPQP